MVGGVVLCGGRSSRMGRPKASLPFAGETMLARVVGVLGGVVSPVVVVAASGQDVPQLTRFESFHAFRLRWYVGHMFYRSSH